MYHFTFKMDREKGTSEICKPSKHQGSLHPVASVVLSPALSKLCRREKMETHVHVVEITLVSKKALRFKCKEVPFFSVFPLPFYFAFLQRRQNYLFGDEEVGICKIPLWERLDSELALYKNRILIDIRAPEYFWNIKCSNFLHLNNSAAENWF